MAYNPETTAEIKIYLSHPVVMKLNEEAFQRGMSRSSFVRAIVEDYVLDEETYEAKGVRENEKN